MILAGDVGGTKIHLALYGFEGGRLSPVRDELFHAHEFSSLQEAVQRFLADEAGAAKASDVAAACFGCPGPVRSGRIQLTNLPWVLDQHELAQALGIQHIFLINDLEANGYGIPEVAPEKIATLHEGDPAAVGNRGLIAAGTGLGEALLIWDGKTHRPVASEGGHCDFAARSDREIGLLNYLREKLGGHVSWERVVSGIGMQNIYAYLRDVEKLEEPPWLRERMAESDPNAVIGACGEDGSSELCAETMKMFASAYGAEAGNIALKVLAVGGMYVGGGIAPKARKTLAAGGFMQAFLDKGRLSPVLEAMPVRIILDETCALLGAAAYAEARAAEVSGRSERAASLQG
ncbi:MAG TPA: glucokinase [Acidobacteriaceae bacterium]|nr:glucokinase [Acidobacteriaceae bacterium]